jgi:hypothetical protein
VKTPNPAQEQIVLGVEDVHAAVPRFSEEVPLRFLVNPTDIEMERMARHEDAADQFEGSSEAVRVVLTLTAMAISKIPVLVGARAQGQKEDENGNGKYRSTPAS